MGVNTKEIADMCKVLSDETRLRILEMVSCHAMCSCDILELLPISQPTLSYHMKHLRQAGLVKCRKEGTLCYYSVHQDGFISLCEALKELSSDTADCPCKIGGDYDKMKECMV